MTPASGVAPPKDAPHVMAVVAIVGLPNVAVTCVYQVKS